MDDNKREAAYHGAEPAHEVEYFDPPRREPTKRERKLAELEMRYEEAVAQARAVPSFYTRRQVKKADRARKTARLPLPARIGAGVLLVAVILGIFAGCVANARAGAEYQECVDQKVAEAGYDAPNQAILDDCR
ncbi:membrane protein [Microbacterium phage TurboVicky]|nr:membrane protein [Microbacterium phage TurboVicky]